MARRSVLSVKAGLPGSIRHRLALLLSELVTSTIQCGGARSHETVEVRLASSPELVRVEVFDPGANGARAAPPGGAGQRIRAAATRPAGRRLGPRGSRGRRHPGLGRGLARALRLASRAGDSRSGPAARMQPLGREQAVEELNRHRALAGCGGHAFHRPVPNVAGREDSRHAGLEGERSTIGRPDEVRRPRSGPVRTKPSASRSIVPGSHSVCGRAPIIRNNPPASTVSSSPPRDRGGPGAPASRRLRRRRSQLPRRTRRLGVASTCRTR